MLSFESNGSYKMAKSVFLHLKFYNDQIHFSQNFSKLAEILIIALFIGYTIFHNFTICESQIVSCCEIGSLHNHNFTISENNNFILQVWSKILARNPRKLLSPVENLGNLK